MESGENIGEKNIGERRKHWRAEKASDRKTLESGESIGESREKHYKEHRKLPWKGEKADEVEGERGIADISTTGVIGPKQFNT